MKGLLFLIFSLISLSFLNKVLTATDTLIPTQFLQDNQTLASSDQTFELGFFSPGSSMNRYLGIWYKNIPIQTVVWVANRDNPLSDRSGLLKLDDNGNLLLLNRTQSVIWSSSNHSSAQNLIAQLLDSGNLVLKYQGNDDPESYIWQSFDYPSNILLERMKIGVNFKTGKNWNLTSWKSPDDPSPSNFTFAIDPRGFPQLVLREGSIEQHRAGSWNGVEFIGAPGLSNNSVYIPIFVANREEVHYEFELVNRSVMSIFVLHPDGLLQRLVWSYRIQDWSDMLVVQKDYCDNYGLCGAYGICNSNKAPRCDCLPGFTPKSPQDWDRIDTSGGCIRKIALNCRNGDGFEKLANVKLPDTSGSRVNQSMSLKECEVLCMNNCSCTAYANSDIRAGGSGCVLWFGDLVDIRQYTVPGQDLYIRLASSELEVNSGSSKKKNRKAVTISVSVVASILLLGLISCCIIRKTRTKQTGNGEHNQNEGYTDESQRGELELTLFDFVTIATATNNFSSDNKLGQGGFGPVYKGELLTGQEIAVKRLSKYSGQGLNEFKNEVILIAKLQHRNLVRLLGCCIQREEKMLIYEYLPNKSLDFFIFGHARTSLSWQKCVDIVVGIAQGLLYLHRDSRLRIIHRDLKASNILLDSDMQPKISDFGMARTFRESQTEAKTKRVVGTYGYMSPEYAIDGLFSMKSDVFSFGVLLLEIISGKKNRGFNHPDHDLNLLGHAWKLWTEGKALKLMDMLVEDGLRVSEVLRCIQVGLLCVQQRPEDRPSMSSVVLMLGSESVILPQPKQPGFYNERCLTESDSLSRVKKFCSSNDATVTLVDGR